MTEWHERFRAEQGIRFESYLGDGVYVGFDGYQLWLWTLEGNHIALEPEVLEQLGKYQADLGPRIGRSEEGFPDRTYRVVSTGSGDGR